MLGELIQMPEQHDNLAAWIEAIAGAVTAVTGVLALAGIGFEYYRQKKRERVQLAQEMIGLLQTDQLLFFAVTVLDWGSAFIVVPELWQKIIPGGKVDWNYDDIRDAITPSISAETRKDPVRLLYRNAFVHLFDHLERIANLVKDGAVEVSDLQSLAWLAKELTAWQYAPENERSKIFMEPLAKWYDNQLVRGLLNDIKNNFPKITQSNAERMPPTHTG